MPCRLRRHDKPVEAPRGSCGMPTWRRGGAGRGGSDDGGGKTVRYEHSSVVIGMFWVSRYSAQPERQLGAVTLGQRLQRKGTDAPPRGGGGGGGEGGTVGCVVEGVGEAGALDVAVCHRHHRSDAVAGKLGSGCLRAPLVVLKRVHLRPRTKRTCNILQDDAV